MCINQKLYDQDTIGTINKLTNTCIINQHRWWTMLPMFIPLTSKIQFTLINTSILMNTLMNVLKFGQIQS